MAEKMKGNAEELVTIVVQRRYEGDKRRFVSMNGQQCSVLTGVPVQIPRWAARLIRQSEEQREANRKMIAKLSQGAPAPKN